MKVKIYIISMMLSLFFTPSAFAEYNVDKVKIWVHNQLDTPITVTLNPTFSKQYLEILPSQPTITVAAQQETTIDYGFIVYSVTPNGTIGQTDINIFGTGWSCTLQVQSGYGSVRRGDSVNIWLILIPSKTTCSGNRIIQASIPFFHTYSLIEVYRK